MINNKTAKGGIGYFGEVTVKVLNGHKIISTYSNHNEGLPYLMTKLCRLFEGTASIASIRPCYIAAYTLAEDEGAYAPAVNATWSELITPTQDKPALLTVASSYCLLDLTLTEEATDTTGASVLYTARIPYSLITAGKIHMLALLPQDINPGDPDIEQKALACYRLANGTRWLPVHCSGNEVDSMLLIEWRLNFSDYGGNE